MPLQAPDESKKYTTAYSDFRGVDFTNDATNVWKRRTPTGLNMMPDMSGKPWKRTGWDIEVTALNFESVLENVFSGKILNMYSFTLGGQDHIIIFTSDGVFAYTAGALNHLLTNKDITQNPYRGFFFEGGGNAGFYFYGGFKMYGYVYDDDTDSFICEEITPYVPTTLIGRSPTGGGTVYEPVNILTDSRTESFLGNSTDKEYYVSGVINVLEPVVVEVKNQDGTYTQLEETTDYTIQFESDASLITMASPHEPTVAGEDNVRITYKTSASTYVAGGMAIKQKMNTRTTTTLFASLTLPVDTYTIEVSYYDANGAQKTLDKKWWELNDNTLTVKMFDSAVGKPESTEIASDFPIPYTRVESGAGSFAHYTFEINYTYTTVEVTYGEHVKAFFDTKTNAIYGTGLANSVFVSGCDNDIYSSRVWYSQVGDPTYFPDLNYFEAGSNDTKIMGLTKVGEYLGIVKQGNAMDSTIYLAYPVNFDDDTAYAVKQSVNGIGAISRKCFDVLGDETLFLSKEGIMAIEPSDAEAERQTKNRSYYINKKLLNENALHEAFSFVWNGFYVLCVNSHCYILDGAQKSSWANEKTNLQYECYYWENVPAICFGEYENDLWFADASGNLCRFKTYEKDGITAYSDNGEIIPCEWSTILDNDGATNFFKNLQKKGCLVTILPMEKTGAKVFVKADDKEPVEIGKITSENDTVPQEFYLNKKVKKYKRLQIIVRNDVLNEGLGLQEIIKIYTMGNYSKNRSVNNGP